MNNVLEYKGYRLFQSSFDRDEKGTILTVNHDKPGTRVSYIGYLLMAIGMLLSLLNKNSRFMQQIKRGGEFAETRRQMMALTLFLMMFSGNAFAGQSSSDEHFHLASKLLVQDYKGRIEPMATLSSDLMRKIYRKEKFADMSATEVILKMVCSPEEWQQKPMIKIGNKNLASDLGISGKYISYEMMFDQKGQYKLKELVENSYAKEPSKRTRYDKEVMNVDERMNLCYQIYHGTFLRFYPEPGHGNGLWNTVRNFGHIGLEPLIEEVREIHNNYLVALRKALEGGNMIEANLALEKIKQFQKKNGADIIPSVKKVNLEVWYYKNDPFGTLARFYFFVGLIFVAISFYDILFRIRHIKIVLKSAYFISLFLFVLFTIVMGIRWYISGHAPWSNGYEAMLLIAWATSLSGVFLGIRSPLSLSATTLLSGVFLIVASMSWANPEITNLVPVLKSYWLIIHVAVITSSYGFLAMAALLALLNLILMIFRNEKNSKRVTLNIAELTSLIEVGLIAGLYMLTIGTFLGGVWANESWGRYWGWDPKETWALISVLVYSVVLHIIRIPKFKGTLLFNVVAFLAFSSVLMTFFGVNFYLSGLHSYAKGEAPPIPIGVYISVVFSAIIILMAYKSEKRKSF